MLAVASKKFNIFFVVVYSFFKFLFFSLLKNITEINDSIKDLTASLRMHPFSNNYLHQNHLFPILHSSSNLASSNFAPSNLAPSNFAPSNFAPSNLSQSSNLAPSNLAPSNLAPSNLAPSNFAPSNLSQSSNLAPSNLSQSSNLAPSSSFFPGSDLDSACSFDILVNSFSPSLQQNIAFSVLLSKK
jgi:hypothetical protein